MFRGGSPPSPEKGIRLILFLMPEILHIENWSKSLILPGSYGYQCGCTPAAKELRSYPSVLVFKINAEIKELSIGVGFEN